jgi:hypothetical protein
MKYGEPIYRRCTGCGHAIEIHPLIEGNHDGSVLWTDGFIESSTMPGQALVAKCGACSEVLWLTDLAPVEAPVASSATSYETLTAGEYFNLLEDLEGLDTDRVCVLRMLAWHEGNHARRGAAVPQELSELELKNLRELDALLGEEWENELLMKIEIAREMRQFGTAKRLMKNVDFSPQVAHLAKQLHRLLEEKSAAPRPFATKGQT